jgi:hypothetical protein
MNRTLQPELLDSLPVDHPAALHNRRDLRVLNRVAGNQRWMIRTLSRQLQPGEVALELGAGTGELGAELNRAGLAADGLDLWPRPVNWPASRAWHVADLRSFDGFGRYAAVCGNLIFHQFSTAELAGLGECLRRHVRVIIASEPTRRRVSQILFRALGPVFGANYVSLHDAHVSIAAGFRGRELADALGLEPSHWDIDCRNSLLGMYRMVAVRRS